MAKQDSINFKLEKIEMKIVSNLIKEPNKKESSKIITNSIIKYKNSIIISHIIFQLFIILSLPKKVFEHYIMIKVNKEGYNQILSNEYKGPFPDSIYVNDTGKNLSIQIEVYVNSTDDEIILYWSNNTISDFTYMFKDLSNINYVYMDYIIGNNSNFSFTFANCVNLQNFDYSTYHESDYNINDMRGMFYNCPSLTFFSFGNLYIDRFRYGTKLFGFTLYNYEYNNINMSYMFYNCQKLAEINFNYDYHYGNVTDMKFMFYNCNSLETIDLSRIEVNNSIDLSYMFYNCIKLSRINFSLYTRNDEDTFGVKDMKEMFYNCESLYEININVNNRSSYYYINMSRLFYNCKCLTYVWNNFSHFYITDTREMFYNCINLESIEFSSYYLYSSINMSKMFYNCKNIKNIIFNNFDNIYYNYSYNVYFPNDMSYIFYNCESLMSLTFNYFNTKYVKNMSYLFYNLKKLSYFKISKSNFSNTYIQSMKGTFQNCESLVTLNLKNFYTTNVEIMWDMFKGCKNLQNLNLSYFDTSKVTDMESMFEGCSNLISLNLTHFITVNVQYMNKMFFNCINLREIYMPYLTTESLSTMYKMFYNCINLNYINIYSLTETGQSLVEMLEGASKSFELCVKEKENIPNIFPVISKEKTIKRDCSEYCYGENKGRVDISSKKYCCPKYKYNDNCYDKCPSRTRDETGNKNCTIFNCPYHYNYNQDSCSTNETIPDGYYINDTIIKTIDKCHEDCKTCDKKATNISTNCLTCNNNKSFYFLGNCYNDCPNGDYYDNNTGIAKCKCFDIKCFNCSRENDTFKCFSCNKEEGYYPTEIDTVNDKGFIDCYKNPEGYFLDKDIEKYRKCYHSCKYCSQFGDKINHYCISCNLNNNYSIPMENSNYTNCYPKCIFNYYFDDDYNYICLKKPGCPTEKKYLIEELKQCVKSCNETEYKHEFRDKCYNICPKDTASFRNNSGFYCKASCPLERPFEMIETQKCVSNFTIMERFEGLCITNYKANNSEEIEIIQEMIMQNIKYDIIDTFNYSYITTNRSLILEEDNLIYEITSTNCSYIHPNVGRIKLLECESLLKYLYGIEPEYPLYILKLDAFVEGKTGPKIEYEVYYPLNDMNLHQLDVRICEGVNILIGFPANISEDEDYLYYKDSSFYNDICYTYAKNGADITIDDRQNDYIDNNRSVCDEGCKYVGFDKVAKLADCSCEVKFNIPFVSQIVIDKSKLYKFMDINQIANFKVMQCYRLLFSKKGIIINIGFYCFLPCFFAYFICIIIFYAKEYKLLKIQINEIVFAKKNEKYLGNINIRRKIEKNKKGKKNVRKTHIFKTFLKKKGIQLSNYNRGEDNDNNGNKIIINKFIDENTNKEDKEKDNDNIDNKNPKNIPPKKSLSNQRKIKGTLAKLSKSSKSRLNIVTYKKTNTKKIESKNTKNCFLGKFNEKQKQKIRDILKFNDTELNELSYKKAFIYEYRSYSQYYISLLMSSHLILRIFANRDYNARSIKVILLFFDFASVYTINALFFTDKTMHKIMLTGGKFDFIYQLPKIAYSTVISIVVGMIINFFALSQNNLIEIKNVKKRKNLGRVAKGILENLHLKFIAFFIICFIIFLLFWYYLGCFCAVYRYTQYHLIKNTVISVVTSYISPFGKCFIPGLFRIPSLAKKSKGKKLMYTLSLLLQKIV